MELTNEQWIRLEPLIPSPQRKQDGRGRPRKNYSTASFGCFEQGAPWKDLSQRYPPHQTCHRWLQTWVRQGVFKQILTELGENLYKRGAIDIRETFIDDSFTP
ncbi:transposase [Thermodesulfobacteriota bacterium]